MADKLAIIIVGVLLIIGSASELFYNFGIAQLTLLNWLIGIARLLGIAFILQTGTLSKSRPIIIIILFLHFVVCIGVLFKIMHWSGADLILMIGLFTVPIIYFIHFLRKTNKELT